MFLSSWTLFALKRCHLRRANRCNWRRSLRHIFRMFASGVACLAAVGLVALQLSTTARLHAHDASVSSYSSSSHVFLPLLVAAFDLDDLPEPPLTASPTPVATATLPSPSEPFGLPRFQEGGRVTAIAVDAPYVYLGIGARLVVLDTSDPAQPRELHRTQILGGRIERIAISDQIAYLAAEISGVHMLDVSERASPRPLGHVRTSTKSLDIEVSGNYAYVAEGRGGLRVLNVSRPESAYETSQTRGAEFCNAVAISGTLGVVADTPVGVRLVDLRDPAAPERVATINPWGSSWYGWSVLDLAINGRFVYALDQADRLWAFDVRVPSQPEVTGSVELDLGGARSARLAVSGGRLSVLANGSLILLDLGSPDVPSIAGTIDELWGHHFCLATERSLAFVGGWDGFRIIDLRPAAFGEAIGEVALEQPPRGRLVAGGDLLYAAPWLLDVSDPSSVERLPDPFGPADRVLAAVGEYAYVDPDDRDRPHKLDIYRMRDPRNPQHIGELATGTYPQQFATVGDVGVLDGSHLGGCPMLTTFSLADPSRPRILGSMEPRHNVYSLASGGGYVFVGMGSGSCDAVRPEPGWLSIVDVSIPSRPTQVGLASVPSAPVSVLFHDGRVILATLRAELWVFDVTDPIRPVPLTVASLPGEPAWGGLATDGRYAYVSVEDDPFRLSTLSWGEVQVIDLAHLDWPAPRGRLSTGAAGALLVHKEHLWSATVGGGIWSWSK